MSFYTILSVENKWRSVAERIASAYTEKRFHIPDTRGPHGGCNDGNHPGLTHFANAGRAHSTTIIYFGKGGLSHFGMTANNCILSMLMGMRMRWLQRMGTSAVRESGRKFSKTSRIACSEPVPFCRVPVFTYTEMNKSSAGRKSNFHTY